MGDERGDDADQRRADVYSSARIGAAAALTIVLVVLLVLDVAVPDYDMSAGIFLPLLGAILALLVCPSCCSTTGATQPDRTNLTGLERGLAAPERRSRSRGRAAATTGEFSVGVSKTGRGERDSPATTDVPITMRIAEPPEPCGWLRSA